MDEKIQELARARQIMLSIEKLAELNKLSPGIINDDVLAQIKNEAKKIIHDTNFENDGHVNGNSLNGSLINNVHSEKLKKFLY
ncbi:MAG: hypothetical protein ACTSVI_08840 [Promethearchaeota archaeon]